MVTKKQPDSKEYERTTAGLRDILFDTILDVRTGRMKNADAKAVAALAKEMIATVDLELSVQRQSAQMDPDSKDALTLAPPPVKMLPGK